MAVMSDLTNDTNELKTYQDGTLKELKERHEKLTEEAIKIWIG